MIDLTFGLTNPFCRRWSTIFYKDKLFFKHKSVEVQVVKDSTIVSFAFQLTTRRDHAGVTLTVGLVGYSAILSLHDTRHWNEEKERYCIYDDAGNAQ